MKIKFEMLGKPQGYTKIWHDEISEDEIIEMYRQREGIDESVSIEIEEIVSR